MINLNLPEPCKSCEHKDFSLVQETLYGNGNPYIDYVGIECHHMPVCGDYISMIVNVDCVEKMTGESEYEKRND